MAKQAHTWREQDLEAWFVANPVLPNGERLVVVSHQTSIRTVVDILCLDRQGRLVFLEAKNERTTRAALGQALEYLSVLAGVTLDDLSAEADIIEVEPTGWTTEGRLGHLRASSLVSATDMPARRAGIMLDAR